MLSALLSALLTALILISAPPWTPLFNDVVGTVVRAAQRLVLADDRLVACGSSAC
jgi:hypothetical protein